MSENLDSEVSEAGKGMLGRRSALKKAAAAGAIVWAAPAIVSDRALAVNTVCTPKCAPDTGGSVFVGADVYCEPGNNGAKWLKVTIGSTGNTLGTCPCQNGAVSTIVGDPTYSPFTGSPQPVVFSSMPSNGIITLILKGPGSGALGQGTYTATVTVVQQCLDRSGRVIQQSCQYPLSVNFQPNNGSCVGSSTAGTGSVGAPVCAAAVCG